jgi:hypothetical protein
MHGHDSLSMIQPAGVQKRLGEVLGNDDHDAVVVAREFGRAHVVREGSPIKSDRARLRLGAALGKERR